MTDEKTGPPWPVEKLRANPWEWCLLFALIGIVIGLPVQFFWQLLT